VSHKHANFGSILRVISTLLGSPPVTHYDTETEAVEHRSTVAALIQQIESKTIEVDPYGDQIVDMEKKAIQEISFDTINELTVLGDHYKFLLDLLTVMSVLRYTK
jgi:hypothetical protein